MFGSVSRFGLAYLNKFHHFRIDATDDDGFGRFLNDNHHSPNLSAKLVRHGSKPIPVFFARRAIEEGEELTYNYGSGSYPWRCGELLPCYEFNSN